MKYFQLIDQSSLHDFEEQKVIKKDTFSTLLEASEIIEEAKRRNEALHEQTLKECAELKEKAYAEGLQEGLEQFDAVLVHLDQKLKALDHKFQQNILQLALKACEKIIGAELKLNSDAILTIIRKAIRPVIESEQVKILVNPEDKKKLDQEKQTIKNMFEHLTSLSIEEKSDLTEGSCIIETEVGIINATMENQLKALEAALKAFAAKK